MIPDDPKMIESLLAKKKQEHRDLDDSIAGLLQQPFVDQFQLKRLKKRKLHIKDIVTQLESMLIPDLNA